MKNLHILALSMLLSTSIMMVHASDENGMSSQSMARPILKRQNGINLSGMNDTENESPNREQLLEEIRQHREDSLDADSSSENAPLKRMMGQFGHPADSDQTVGIQERILP